MMRFANILLKMGELRMKFEGNRLNLKKFSQKLNKKKINFVGMSRHSYKNSRNS